MINILYEILNNAVAVGRSKRYALFNGSDDPVGGEV